MSEALLVTAVIGIVQGLLLFPCFSAAYALRMRLGAPKWIDVPVGMGLWAASMALTAAVGDRILIIDFRVGKFGWWHIGMMIGVLLGAVVVGPRWPKRNG